MANPAIPTNVRALNGNPGKRALHTPGEPDPEYLNDPAPPPFLTSPRAIEVWNYIAPKLMAAKLVCWVDVITLARYCEDVAECWTAQQLVSEYLQRGEMPILEGAKGGFNYHPAVVLRNRSAERADKGAAHFGLSPMCRTRIKTQPQTDLFANDFESFVRQLHAA